MKTDNELFDSKIKATLDSGLEDVPASAWESIEARLDAAGSAGEKPFAWLRRPAFRRAALALCCCAALCFILLRPASQPANEVQLAAAPEITAPEEIAAPAEITAEPALPQNNLLAINEMPSENQPVKVAKKAVSKATAPTDKELTAEAKPQETEAVQIAKAAEATKIAEATETAEEVAAPSQAPATQQKAEIYQYQTNAEDVEFPQEKERKHNKFSVACLTADFNSGTHMGTSRSTVSRMAAQQQMNSFGKEKVYEDGRKNSFFIPLTFGLGVRFNFNERWSLGTGVSYSYLGRTFSGEYQNPELPENYYCEKIRHSLHYIGIPVNLYHNIAVSDRFRFYVSVGGTVEKAISNRYSFMQDNHTVTFRDDVLGVQLSAACGIGLEYRLTDRMGLYLDPNFRYYFKDYRQPKNIRTAQPFQINCELGLRWNFLK